MRPKNNPEFLAKRRVELFAAMCQVTDRQTYCANPRLSDVLKLIPDLALSPAAEVVRRVKKELGRDRAIKWLILDSYGLNIPDQAFEFVAEIDMLSSQWDTILGGVSTVLQDKSKEMIRRSASLSENLDPASDLALLTGENDQLRIIVAPSLFLPPPQTGRHGALLSMTDGSGVAHLHFGYPMDDDPQRFGITDYWIIGGGWHYAIDRFLHRHWAPVRDTLASMPDLETSVRHALAPHREHVSWPIVIAEHINIAIKCHLSRHYDVPELVHRGFARARGLALFPWFDKWIETLSTEPEKFISRFHQLPETLLKERDEWEQMARHVPSGPPSINFALVSVEKRAVIIVPDHWSQSVVDSIAKRWSMITVEIHRQGQSFDIIDNKPLIVFGEAGRDLMVDNMLAERELVLGGKPGDSNLLIALIPPSQAGCALKLVVAVNDPLIAVSFGAEHALDLFHSYARFNDGLFVEGDGGASLIQFSK